MPTDDETLVLKQFAEHQQKQAKRKRLISRIALTISALTFAVYFSLRWRESLPKIMEHLRTFADLAADAFVVTMSFLLLAVFVEMLVEKIFSLADRIRKRRREALLSAREQPENQSSETNSPRRTSV